MKRNLFRCKNIFCAFMVIFFIQGCSKNFKLKHTTAPDESMVSTRPALSVPPNFNLPTPKNLEQNTKKNTKKQKSSSNLHQNSKLNLAKPRKSLKPKYLPDDDKLFIEKIQKDANVQTKSSKTDAMPITSED